MNQFLKEVLNGTLFCFSIEKKNKLLKMTERKTRGEKIEIIWNERGFIFKNDTMMIALAEIIEGIIAIFSICRSCNLIQIRNKRHKVLAIGAIFHWIFRNYCFWSSIWCLTFAIVLMFIHLKIDQVQMHCCK